MSRGQLSFAPFSKLGETLATLCVIDLKLTNGETIDALMRSWAVTVGLIPTRQLALAHLVSRALTSQRTAFREMMGNCNGLYGAPRVRLPSSPRCAPWVARHLENEGVRCVLRTFRRDRIVVAMFDSSRFIESAQKAGYEWQSDAAAASHGFRRYQPPETIQPTQTPSDACSHTQSKRCCRCSMHGTPSPTGPPWWTLG